MVCYTDDVNVLGKSDAEHSENLREVLSLLLKYGRQEKHKHLEGPNVDLLDHSLEAHA